MSAVLAGVCLALAASTADPVQVPATHFTLAWTHSIEKTRWEEDYAVERTPRGLRLLARDARIRGSGAGMEPPAGAVLRDGWYVYRPSTPPLEELHLTRSPFTADYDWCVDGRCRPLQDLLAADGGVTRLWPCEMPAQPGRLR